MKRARPYDGQEWTDQGKRGTQLVSGLTVRDIADCFIRAYILSHASTDQAGTDLLPNRSLREECARGENAKIAYNDVYSLVGDASPIAIGQNLTCEIEKAMGIFPNLPEDKFGEQK